MGSRAQLSTVREQLSAAALAAFDVKRKLQDELASVTASIASVEKDMEVCHDERRKGTNPKRNPPIGNSSDELENAAYDSRCQELLRHCVMMATGKEMYQADDSFPRIKREPPPSLSPPPP
jgi:hypothetical protein